MGVLPAIFPHARQVPFDVAGIQVRICRTADPAIGSAHRPGGQVACRPRPWPCASAAALARAGKDRPALRNRIDLAFGVLRGAQRRRRRRSRRAGTIRRPSRAARYSGAAARLRSRQRSAKRRSPRSRASSPNCVSTSYRKKPSQTLSPLPCSPTRFMPSFQSPRAHQRQAVLAEAQARVDRRARNARTAFAASSDCAGQIVVRRPRPASAAGLRGNGPVRRARRCRRCSAHSGTSPTAATGNHPNNACAHRGPSGGCHQCWTSPSRNWCAAQRSRCSRTRLGSAWISAITSCS